MKISQVQAQLAALARMHCADLGGIQTDEFNLCLTLASIFSFPHPRPPLTPMGSIQ